MRRKDMIEPNLIALTRTNGQPPLDGTLHLNVEQLFQSKPQLHFARISTTTTTLRVLLDEDLLLIIFHAYFAVLSNRLVAFMHTICFTLLPQVRHYTFANSR